MTGETAITDHEKLLIIMVHRARGKSLDEEAGIKSTALFCHVPEQEVKDALAKWRNSYPVSANVIELRSIGAKEEG